LQGMPGFHTVRAREHECSCGSSHCGCSNLTALVDSVVTPNGMYGELVYFAHPDEFAPVAESAYCGAGSLHTMLLHTSPKSGVLHIFPGVPSEWRDATFHNLRADGGILVSAVRKDSAICFVRLLHGTGTRTMVHVEDKAWSESLRAQPANTSIQALGAGLWAVDIPAGIAVLLYPSARPTPNFSIAPVSGNASEENWFGYRWTMPPLH